MCWLPLLKHKINCLSSRHYALFSYGTKLSSSPHLSLHSVLYHLHLGISGSTVFNSISTIFFSWKGTFFCSRGCNGNRVKDQTNHYTNRFSPSMSPVPLLQCQLWHGSGHLAWDCSFAKSFDLHSLITAITSLQVAPSHHYQSISSSQGHILIEIGISSASTHMTCISSTL